MYGYHKPIMIAGGLGNISGLHTKKEALPVGSLLIQLGGPGMRIGMGGGAASSMATGANTADLVVDVEECPIADPAFGPIEELLA